MNVRSCHLYAIWTHSIGGKYVYFSYINASILSPALTLVTVLWRAVALANAFSLATTLLTSRCFGINTTGKNPGLYQRPYYLKIDYFYMFGGIFTSFVRYLHSLDKNSTTTRRFVAYFMWGVHVLYFCSRCLSARIILFGL